MSGICRDCLKPLPKDRGRRARCPRCGQPRTLEHPELFDLSIAHIDCDAFYASVEKRDRPELREKPVIVGGGKRGVVSAACYVARLHGVRSAMPMFKALKACPDAVVIRPEMAKYQAIGRRLRERMLELTPAVEPISIDEAFLDLAGTEALHRETPAQTLARFARRVEADFDLTVSVGLSYNKFLAKIASDLDKPRGFAVIGRAEALEFLRDRPVGLIWGVGKTLRRALAKQGITKISHLWDYERDDLVARFGAMGRRLYHLSRGEDSRRVAPRSPAKSISSETTFSDDIDTLEPLAARLWPLCETVSRRLKRANLAGHTVTLKLKQADFRIVTRGRRLSHPTQLAEVIYRAAHALLEPEADGRAFRLIGVGLSDFEPGERADPPDLLDPERGRQAKVERAIDAVRDKLGDDAIHKGRRFGPPISTPDRAGPPDRPSRRRPRNP